MPFFAKAAIDALKQHPSLNAAIDTEKGEVTYFDSENLAIAVDTEKGLLTPVIKDAGDLSIAGLARKIADVADRTRTNKITPDELSGGTFTLTNTGSRGALFDTPIINQPQVAILGTGTVVKRPVVIDDPNLGETIAVRSMVYLALTYDHRLVDGADAGPFPPRGQAAPRGRSVRGLTTPCRLRDQPGLVGEHGELHPVPQRELGQQPRHVRLHGRLAEEQLGADRGVGHAAGDQAEHVELTLAQVGEGRQVGRPARGRPRTARGGAGSVPARASCRPAPRPDGVYQIVGRDVLEQEPAGAGPDGRIDVLVQVEGRQRQHPDLGQLAEQLPSASIPSRRGIRTSMRTTSGNRPWRTTSSASSPSPACPTTSIARALQDQREPGSDQLLVVDDHHPHARVAHADSPTGSTARTAKPGAVHATRPRRVPPYSARPLAHPHQSVPARRIRGARPRRR